MNHIIESAVAHQRAVDLVVEARTDLAQALRIRQIVELAIGTGLVEGEPADWPNLFSQAWALAVREAKVKRSPTSSGLDPAQQSGV